MGGDLNRRTWSPQDVGTPKERRTASRYVVRVATSKAEAIALLATLGLLPAGHPALFAHVQHGLPGYRAGCRCERCRKANQNRVQKQRKKEHQ
ncbi:hypothetical protein ACIRQH_34760 [Streptomyces sp. NPDC102279]|uniref:hypothetical protein n=1 Tax=Streptomyces sp. NPDC102279 TaxID=3366153 RepID=UPI0038182610